MHERPKWRKWRRRVKAGKVCPRCGRRHAPVMRVQGRVIRPKVCIDCGASLPTRLRDAAKAATQWYVREFNPATGETRDIAVDSSEAADDTIRTLSRDWTPDPIQAWLVEHASTLARGITATDRDDAVNQLVVKLGGDPTARQLRPVGVEEAIEQVCQELRTQENASEVYCLEVSRVTHDFLAVSGISTWSDMEVDHVKRYAKALASGDFKREGRRVRPVSAHTRAKCLRTLRAAVCRMQQNRWVHPKVTAKEADSAWAQATGSVDHEYLPDSAFAAVVDAAGDDRWMRTLLLVAYNTAGRLGDLLSLTWRDVDLEGTGESSGRAMPTIRIANRKSRKRVKNKEPVFAPLDCRVIEALRDLRANPVAVVMRHTSPEAAKILVGADGLADDNEHVFAVRGYAKPKSEISTRVADLFVRAGFKDADGGPRWTLHDLRRKANQDIMRAGGTIREAMSLTGHSSPSVNIANYQSDGELERMRTLTSRMSGFKLLKLVRESA